MKLKYKINKKKLMKIFLILIMILMCFVTEIQATSLNINSSISKANNFAKKKSNLINFEVVYYIFDYAYNLLLMIGIIIAIIYGTILGIRMILGSLEERADARQMIIPYVATVGIMAFALTIIKIIMNIAYQVI